MKYNNSVVRTGTCSIGQGSSGCTAVTYGTIFVSFLFGKMHKNSNIMTICYGIHQYLFREDSLTALSCELNDSFTLTVHCLGATETEYHNKTQFKDQCSPIFEMLHHYNSSHCNAIKCLQLELIGPELLTPDMPVNCAVGLNEDRNPGYANLEYHVQEGDTRISVALHRCYYHDYLTHYAPPLRSSISALNEVATSPVSDLDTGSEPGYVTGDINNCNSDGCMEVARSSRPHAIFMLNAG